MELIRKAFWGGNPPSFIGASHSLDAHMHTYIQLVTNKQSHHGAQRTEGPKGHILRPLGLSLTQSLGLGCGEMEEELSDLLQEGKGRQPHWFCISPVFWVGQDVQGGEFQGVCKEGWHLLWMPLFSPQRIRPSLQVTAAKE